MTGCKISESLVGFSANEIGEVKRTIIMELTNQNLLREPQYSKITSKSMSGNGKDSLNVKKSLQRCARSSVRASVVVHIEQYPIPLSEGVPRKTYKSGEYSSRLNDAPSSVLALSLEASLEMIAISPTEHNLAKAFASLTSDGEYISLSGGTSSSPLKHLEILQAS